VTPGKPLEGLLVVSMEQAVAAPTCSAKLADAGARVIKLERAEGDFARKYDAACNGLSTYFVWLNRGKESLRLDIKAPDDKALLERILAKADVFIQNLAPGAMGRAGFGSAELRARHPRLITVDISGYGEEGEYASMKAYDLLVQAESGLAAVTGRAEGPGRVGFSVCDIACGTMAHAAVLEALIERGITGPGKGIAVSLFDGMADWMNVPLLYFEGTGVQPARIGLAHPPSAPTAPSTRATAPRCSSRSRTSANGRSSARASWRSRSCRARGLPLQRGARGAPADGGRAHRRRLRRPRPRRLRREAHRASIAYGFVNGVDGLSRHPALRRVTVETERGPVAIAAPAARFSDGERALGPVPALGAHDAAIRAEFAA
jgi:crotonobetainyl-CoA:carnitine CoA-transferase CaiB-like acyl-CoA transferase